MALRSEREQLWCAVRREQHLMNVEFDPQSPEDQKQLDALNLEAFAALLQELLKMIEAKESAAGEPKGEAA